jgi:predicted nucleotidyltransferase
MSRPILTSALKPFEATLRDNGATGVYLFGSRAGRGQSDGDLDLIIDYNPAARVPDMVRLMQLEEELSRALGARVTITTRNALHPLTKAQIERDLIRVL